ncbi:MAG TPA: dTDP-4-dehydrorhamnose 3,5-epimerase [Telluria sp.]|nr:dTDP-4-dehydrorhamnose 3,5-epimerase [Telluria sp.]
MKILPTSLPGCHLLVPDVRRDERGCFAKVFHRDTFIAAGLCADFAEDFYSVSHQGVLRGLHFQTPPHEQAKLVYCLDGAVFDVGVDLRRGSPTYGRHLSLELSAENGHVLYLAPGVAHGFYTLTGSALMVYKVSRVYAPANDTGILWNSAGIAWPGGDPVLSVRDREFAALADFDSPFVYEGAA